MHEKCMQQFQKFQLNVYPIRNGTFLCFQTNSHRIVIDTMYQECSDRLVVKL